MFTSIKSFFSKLIVQDPMAKKETVLQPLPIEVNSSTNNLTNRKKARLERLLSIQQPSAEIKAEIAYLKQLLKGSN